jgi:hypothetical protein
MYIDHHHLALDLPLHSTHRAVIVDQLLVGVGDSQRLPK